MGWYSVYGGVDLGLTISQVISATELLPDGTPATTNSFPDRNGYCYAMA